jgi:GTPase SAR1 family protein
MINKINHPSKFVKSKYKIGLVGSYCSGKSSLANRFAHGFFSDEYRMTLSTSHQIRIQLLQQNCSARRLPLP